MASLPQLSLLSHTALPFAHFQYAFAKIVAKIESSSDLLYPDLFWYQTSIFFLTASFVTLLFVRGNSLPGDKRAQQPGFSLPRYFRMLPNGLCDGQRGPWCRESVWDPAGFQLSGGAGTSACRYGERQPPRGQASTQSGHGLMQEISFPKLLQLGFCTHINNNSNEIWNFITRNILLLPS